MSEWYLVFLQSSTDHSLKAEKRTNDCVLTPSCLPGPEVHFPYKQVLNHTFQLAESSGKVLWRFRETFDKTVLRKKWKIIF